MEKKLSKLFYSTDGYWKGITAIKKLMDISGAPEKIVEPWIRKKILWQLYLPKPKYIPHPHYQITEPDKVHQADLLFLPHDRVGRKIDKYGLVVVDIASRYKDAEPLESKNSFEISKKFEKIYSRRLGWPKTLMVDPGREFMGEVTKLMTKHGTHIKLSDAGNHRAQAFVERANRTLGEKIFSHQSAQELVTGGVSKEWVWRLPGLIKNMNHKKN